ncbi:MAG TPA: efflux RND transporter periplasmic adaptor subunit [Burkholderiales bacterium]|nr:efflux RND transporter periplasmic adaptor subunit [Burkholderiales bacterium]
MIPRTRPGRIVGIVVALAAAAAGYAWYQARVGDGRPRYRTAQVERGPLQATLAASGTLHAVSTVQVVPRVSGQVKEIYADFNTPVKKGEVLARIDPSEYELRLNQARADLDAAESEVALARSQLDADLAEAGKKKKRARAAQLRLGKARVASALAAVEQRQAQLQQAQAALERTTIRAPVDGTVILRNVDAGQTVAVSPAAPALFVIAQDLHEMRVEAAVDQADVGRLRVGQSATFTVDAFPRRSFGGEIRQIRKSPQNVRNVVSYTVVIAAPNPDLALLPGMSANVQVVLERRDNALKLPNAALRFHPPGAQAGSRVWILAQGKLQAVDLRLGLSDGTSTEVLSGPLKQGDDVVIGAIDARSESPPTP